MKKSTTKQTSTTSTSTNKKETPPTKKKVYVLHHSFIGTPESGEIHSIYSSMRDAKSAMKRVLDEDYDGATPADNEDGEYMYITTQTLIG